MTQIVRKRIYVKGKGFREVMTRVFDQVKTIAQTPQARGLAALAATKGLEQAQNYVRDLAAKNNMPTPAVNIMNEAAKGVNKLNNAIKEGTINNMMAQFGNPTPQQTNTPPAEVARPGRRRNLAGGGVKKLIGDIPTTLNNYTNKPPALPPIKTEDIQMLINAAISGKKGKKAQKAQKGSGFSIAR